MIAGFFLRKCTRCDRGFDIGIDNNLCPVCREKVKEGKTQKGVDEYGRKN